MTPRSRERFRSGYGQLSLEDRCEIARLQANGVSIRQIAAALDRAPSTVARELKRNRGRHVGYKPSYAEDQARARRWSGSRLEREGDLRQRVMDRLAMGWSPEQVAGRLALEAGRPVISHETIYRFIHAQIARTKDYSWRRLLPRGKSKRGFRGRKGGSPAFFIEGRVPVAERPAEANDRATPGHWEADLMLFAKYGQAVLAIHERQSRIVIAARPPSKAADGVADRLVTFFTVMPPDLRQTVTFDNGTEFARHTRLHQIAIRTFFCDRYSPGRRVGSRTPSAASAASSRAKLISPPSPKTASTQSSAPTTTSPENALPTKPPPRSSRVNCCTSNVNPPPRFRGDER